MTKEDFYIGDYIGYYGHVARIIDKREMFGFIFYNMPSGMVLYWVVNTILTIVEQSAILKNPA